MYSQIFPISGPTVTQRINYILVDFENVQPKDVGLLKEGPFKVKIFLGPNQSKIPVALASTLQSLGESAEYVILEAAGNNALDFHIAYYLGALAFQDSTGFFHVISKDTGFDPLLKHLKGQGVWAQRSTCIAEIPYFQKKPQVSGEETLECLVERAVTDLVRRKNSRPRTQKTLLATLNALFKKELPEQRLEALFDLLCARGIVKLEGTKVSYALPAVGAK